MSWIALTGTAFTFKSRSDVTNSGKNVFFSRHELTATIPLPEYLSVPPSKKGFYLLHSFLLFRPNSKGQ
jgi:hypothetical protein